MKWKELKMREREMCIRDSSFDPRLWKRMIEAEQATSVYLIPVKLRALRRIYEREQAVNYRIISFVSGSQSMGGAEAVQFKKAFPEAEITLYYGASELNYITSVSYTHLGQVIAQLCSIIFHNHRHLFPVDVGVRCKGSGGNTFHNTDLRRPVHIGSIVSVGFHIGEFPGLVTVRVDARQPPQSCHKHSSGHAGVRAKGGVAGAGEQSPAGCKEDVICLSLIHIWM